MNEQIGVFLETIVLPISLIAVLSLGALVAIFLIGIIVISILLLVKMALASRNMGISSRSVHPGKIKDVKNDQNDAKKKKKKSSEEILGLTDDDFENEVVRIEDAPQISVKAGKQEEIFFVNYEHQ